MPDKSILNNCKIRNPDGIGYMYLKNKEVNIRKGFWTVKDLLKSIDNNVQNSTDLDIAIHFRYSTHGVISENNCHPFPITQKIKDLRSTDIKCKRGIMHNGVVPNMTHVDTKLSDTMIAIKTLSVYPYDAPEAQSIFSTGKFLIFDADQWMIYTHGEFIKDNGVYYSNSGYKRQTYYNYSAYSPYSHEYVSTKKYKSIYNKCLYCADPTAKHCLKCLDYNGGKYESENSRSKEFVDLSNW